MQTSFRTKNNKAGVSYDESKADQIFAEDVEAVETAINKAEAELDLTNENDRVSESLIAKAHGVETISTSALVKVLATINIPANTFRRGDLLRCEISRFTSPGTMYDVMYTDLIVQREGQADIKLLDGQDITSVEDIKVWSFPDHASNMLKSEYWGPSQMAVGFDIAAAFTLVLGANLWAGFEGEADTVYWNLKVTRVRGA